MRFTASDFQLLYAPSYCEKRVALSRQGLQASPPGPYEEVLRRLGERHEQALLADLPGLVNLAAIKPDRRAAATRRAITDGAPAIYHPRFSGTLHIAGYTVDIQGEPDLLLRDGEEYRIRDIKIALRISGKDHPHIVRQLQCYAWLYRQTVEREPSALEVWNGKREIIPLEDDHGQDVLPVMETIICLMGGEKESFSPVGWTKCQGCGYRYHCWPEAVRERQAALVPGVDQGLALQLHRTGVDTISQLVEEYDEESLAAVRRPWGNGLQKVGKQAREIMPNARALHTNREIFLRPPRLPEYNNYVMFDLEGLPPQLDVFQKIYLWGMQVFGERPSVFLPALAEIGPEGDRLGWQAFLGTAQKIFETYGEIPFVHWHHYEKTNINLYIRRYGDPDGIARRVLEQCIDLLPITRESIALPLPSYGLKVVEQYVGFQRSMDEFGGDWSIAKYIEATETEDDTVRQEILDTILKYNEEDLQATWAVFRWLKSKNSGAAG